MALMKNNKPVSRVYLPAELWPGTLCRLPVKSLVRFRCVSKSWLALINDAEVTHLHLKSFKNNCDESHLLLVNGSDRDCVVKCSDTFQTSSETLVTLGHGEYYHKNSWHIVCSMDGLVLLKRSRSTRSEDELKVWNPSIRKFREFLPLSEIIEPPPKGACVPMNRNDLGLGYDTLVNDYKHVRLMLSKPNVLSVAVYSLGTGSWKIIPFQGKGSSCSKWNWDWILVCRSPKVYFRGNLHLVASRCSTCPYWQLVSFDLSSEVFSSINMPKLPNTLCLYDGWNNLVVVDGGRSLAAFEVVNRALFHAFVGVWVLDGESMCWKKRYSLVSCLPFYQFWYVKKNWDVLTQKARCETFTDDEVGEITVMWDEVVSYNLETEEYEIVQDSRGSSIYPITQVFAYVESLLLLN